MPVSIAHNYMFILLFYRTDLYLFGHKPKVFTGILVTVQIVGH